jgi:cation diffusion facilitator family transporter
VRDRAVARVFWITLAINLAVAVAKVIVGRHFHVLALVADGVHSTLDAGNNVVGLAILARAARPADAGHPYGHRKLESFGALAIGLSLVLVGVGVVRSAIARIGTPSVAEAHPITFIVAIATLAINLATSRYEASRGRALGSELLCADAAHTLGDVFVTASVLAGLVAVRLHYPAADVIAALVIALVIFIQAAKILRTSVRVLADAAALDPEVLRAIATAVEGVRECHHIRSRGPAGYVFVDLHLHVDPSLPTAASHRLGHEVAHRLRAAGLGVIEVMVHVEPHGHEEDPDEL